MENYELLYSKVKDFLKSWESKDVDKLNEIFKSDLICYLSTVVEYIDGSQHSRSGIKNFILDTPNSDYFHISMYNFVCRYNSSKAQTSFITVGRAINRINEHICSFEFTAEFVISWENVNDEWLGYEMRMQVTDYHGDLEIFKSWYFEDQKAKWYPGIHLPVIQGELDNPWFVIQNSERIMSDQEQIEEQLYRFAFGEDMLAFNQVEATLSDDFLAEMAPWGIMDKRLFMTAVKHHRTRTLTWAHPLKIKSIELNDNVADVVAYRITGHRQRTRETILDESNYNHEFSCAHYRLRLKKINNIWKLFEFHYYLGIQDLGEYIDSDLM